MNDAKRIAAYSVVAHHYNGRVELSEPTHESLAAARRHAMGIAKRCNHATIVATADGHVVDAFQAVIGLQGGRETKVVQAKWAIG
jgi:hypothetical protein